MSQAQLTGKTQTTSLTGVEFGWTQIRRLLLYLLFISMTLVFIMPVIWLLLTSLKTQNEFARYPITIFPEVPQWQNYYVAVIEYPFLRYTVNSLTLAIPSTILTVFSSALAGFAFARHNAPLKRILFILVISMMMVPRMVTVIPTFILFSKMSLTNTYWPWILWGIAGSPFHIFLFRQFFAAIPKDLEDAA